MTDHALADRAATGVKGLDEILGGGLVRNRLYLIEGRTGTGKTTLGLQFILEGKRRGERVLYITLSETIEELQAVAASHGWSLEGVALFEMNTPDENLRPQAQYTLFHPSEVELSENTQLLVAEIDRVDPDRVVLDTLSSLRLLAEDPLRYRRQVEMLRQYLTRQRCTTLIIDETSEQTVDFQARNLAHGIIGLDKTVQDYGPERRRLRIDKLRGVAFPSGHHDLEICTGGIRVFPRLVAADYSHDRADQGVVSSGVAALDALLGGGLERGSNALLTGPAGAGKSTLALQFAFAAATRGETTTVFLFDESIETLRVRCRGLGLDVDTFEGRGLVHFQRIDPGAMSPGQFAWEIRNQVESRNAQMVIIDSLGGYLHAMPQENYLDLHLHELLAYLGHRQVLTLLVMAQKGYVGPDMMSPADLSYLADTVVLLRFFEAAGEIRQVVSVVKKRGGQHERTLREFQIAPGGVRVGEPLRDFHGVLTGVPGYSGPREPLMEGHE